MNVYTATYEHRHGRDSRVFASAELAEAWRREIAAENWPSILADKPADPEECADLYFERESHGESFNVECCPVEGFDTTAAWLALQAQGMHIVVALDADEIREDLDDLDGDTQDLVGATDEQINECCAIIAEQDWSDTYSEAKSNVKERLREMLAEKVTP